MNLVKTDQGTTEIEVIGHIHDTTIIHSKRKTQEKEIMSRLMMLMTKAFALWAIEIR